MKQVIKLKDKYTSLKSWAMAFGFSKVMTFKNKQFTFRKENKEYEVVIEDMDSARLTTGALGSISFVFDKSLMGQ